MVGDDEKIIIAFRGTENLTDWMTNMKLLKAVWKVGTVHAVVRSPVPEVSTRASSSKYQRDRI